MKVCGDQLLHNSFWRGLDENESTALYSADKIKNLFQNIGEEFSNDELKKVFGGDSYDSEVWTFVFKSNIIEYYYSDYNTISELLLFLKYLREAYGMTKSLTLSNKYV